MRTKWQNLLAPLQPVLSRCLQHLLAAKPSSVSALYKRTKDKHSRRRKLQHTVNNSKLPQHLKEMKPIDDKKDTVAIRAVSHNEEGRKRVEKTELKTHNIDTIKYMEKKLRDKGVQRMERHPADGIGIGRPPPKSGHGGKYTWEGPDDLAETEMIAAPPAIDEKDPNFVDEEAEEKILRGENSDVAGIVVGEVEVAKAAEDKEGVARIDVDPQLQPILS